MPESVSYFHTAMPFLPQVSKELVALFVILKIRHECIKNR
jgi:hypothetical protein